MSGYGVVLFFTTSSVMAAEKKMIANGLAIKLIPTPRQFSSDCGISLRFSWDKRREIEAVLLAENIEYEAIRPLK